MKHRKAAISPPAPPFTYLHSIEHSACLPLVVHPSDEVLLSLQIRQCGVDAKVEPRLQRVAGVVLFGVLQRCNGQVGLALLDINQRYLDDGVWHYVVVLAEGLLQSDGGFKASAGVGREGLA